jgi:hypothetical protein
MKKKSLLSSSWGSEHKAGPFQSNRLRSKQQTPQALKMDSSLYLRPESTAYWLILKYFWRSDSRRDFSIEMRICK